MTLQKPKVPAMSHLIPEQLTLETTYVLSFDRMSTRIYVFDTYGKGLIVKTVAWSI